MSNPEETVSQLVVADTCSWLDLIRLAIREHPYPTELAAARMLAEHPQRKRDEMALAVSDATIDEFAANVDKVVQETRENLRGLRKRITRADEVADHLGIPHLSVGLRSGWEDEIANIARDLVNGWLTDAVVLDTSGDELRLANNRTRLRRPPAKQGSSSTHDCIIVERAMRAARNRPRESTWFITGNHRDFAPDGGRLDPGLEQEFAGCGLQFAATWSEVQGRLGL